MASANKLHSIEAEQAVLGSLLLNNGLYGKLGRFLRAEHFFDPLHGAIFAASEALLNDNRPANPITVLPAIGDQPLGDSSTKSYLIALVSRRTLSPDIESLAELVRDYAVSRRLAAIGGQVAGAGEQPRSANERAFDEIDMVRGDLAGAIDKREALGALAERFLDSVERRREGKEEVLRYSTGLPDLDKDLQGGLYAGELTILAGRPGMGKTALACSLARRIAKTEGERCGVYLLSFEVNDEQVAARMLADQVYRKTDALGFGKILKGSDLDAEEMWRLEEGRVLLAKLPLMVDTTSNLSLGQVVQRVKAEKERLARQNRRLGPVIIDYLKYIRASARYRGQRHLEVGEITAGLRQAAKDLEVPMVLLVQLNRQVEQQGRGDRRPNLGDLRDSGEIEQDADVVIFAYRDHYYVINSPEYRAGNADALIKASQVEHDFEAIIAKNRKGPTRTVMLYCDIACSHISQSARGLVL